MKHILCLLSMANILNASQEPSNLFTSQNILLRPIASIISKAAHLIYPKANIGIKKWLLTNTPCIPLQSDPQDVWEFFYSKNINQIYGIKNSIYRIELTEYYTDNRIQKYVFSNNTSLYESVIWHNMVLLVHTCEFSPMNTEEKSNYIDIIKYIQPQGPDFNYTQINHMIQNLKPKNLKQQDLNKQRFPVIGEFPKYKLEHFGIQTN